MKIRPVGLGVHADGQIRRADTDIRVYDEANRRFTQFCQCAYEELTKERSHSGHLGPRALV